MTGTTKVVHTDRVVRTTNAVIIATGSAYRRLNAPGE
jgi:thioredoxin reductase